MGTSIVIASGKGGTGKTACTAAIGSFLAAMGHPTLCVDCDAALKNLDLTLGLSDAVLWDFRDVLRGKLSASEAVVSHPRIDGLCFLSAPADLELEPGDAEKFRDLVSRLKDRYDYILLDSPAGIGPGFRLAASAADMAIIVATGDLTSLRDGQRTAMELRSLGVGELRLIVNRVSPRAYRRVRRDVDEIIDAVGARLIGVVSEDDNVGEAGNLQIPLFIYGSRRAWGQFRDIARRIDGQRVPLGKT